MDTASCPIVITGTGTVTAAGIGMPPLLAALKEGRSCLHPVPEELFGHTAGVLWGRVDHFKPSDFMPPLKARKLDRGSQFAVAAAGLALAESGITKGSLPAERIGIALGCGFGGIANSAEFLSGYFQQGVAGLSPLLFPNTVANAPASNTSIEHGLKGPNITFVQRFCSAESAILAACRYIEEGRADVMLAGGVDELTPLMMKGFAAMGQLHGHARGFGEGAGIIVLERGDHAAARGVAVKGQLGRITTIGLLLPGNEQQGIDRLLPGPRIFDHIAISGADEFVEPLLSAVHAPQITCPGPMIGRSLAMGGTTLAVLTALLWPGAEAVQLSASPEGPLFAITLKGGHPA